MVPRSVLCVGRGLVQWPPEPKVFPGTVRILSGIFFHSRPKCRSAGSFRRAKPDVLGALCHLAGSCLRCNLRTVDAKSGQFDGTTAHTSGATRAPQRAPAVGLRRRHESPADRALTPAGACNLASCERTISVDWECGEVPTASISDLPRSHTSEGRCLCPPSTTLRKKSPP